MNFPPKPTKTPAYTPEQRKQIAACFRAAKKRLWSGRSVRRAEESHICFCIRNLYGVAAKLACREIELRLAPYSSVRTWLAHTESIPLSGTPEVIPYVQDYRHAWLDSLIAEFEGTEE